MSVTPSPGNQSPRDDDLADRTLALRPGARPPARPVAAAQCPVLAPPEIPEPAEAPLPGPSDRTPEPVFDAGPRCIKCGRRPVRPNAGGLCPSCHFLRSVEANRDNPAGTAPAATPIRTLVARTLRCCLQPSWVWVLLLGWAGVAGLAALTLSNLIPGMHRRTWVVVELTVALLTAAVAQLRALVLVSLGDARLGPADLLLPSPRLWLGALRALPETRWPVCLMAWALALAAAALFLALA
jgi:hypothetical protein